MPRPSTSPENRRNGSKTRFTCPAVMPRPLSLTLNNQPPAVGSEEMCTSAVWPAFRYLRAFSMRLTKINRMPRGPALMVGKPSTETSPADLRVRQRRSITTSSAMRCMSTSASVDSPPSLACSRRPSTSDVTRSADSSSHPAIWSRSTSGASVMVDSMRAQLATLRSGSLRSWATSMANRFQWSAFGLSVCSISGAIFNFSVNILADGVRKALLKLPPPQRNRCRSSHRPRFSRCF